MPPGWTSQTCFSILDFPYKTWQTPPKIALQISKSRCACFFVQLNIHLNGGSWNGLTVNFVLIVDERLQLELISILAYQIFNNVAERAVTQRKFTVRILWYMFNTPLKWELMKQTSGWAVSLAGRGLFHRGPLGRKLFFIPEDLAIFWWWKIHCIVNSTPACWRPFAVRLAYIPTWSYFPSYFLTYHHIIAEMWPQSYFL